MENILKRCSKKILMLALVSGFVTIPCLSFGKELIIAGSQATGTWFIFSGAVSQQINAHLPGVSASPTPSSGSTENVINIDKGDIDLGMVLPEVAYNAYHGKDTFKTPVTNLRALFNTYSFPLHIITLRDSKINKIEDLKGKRVAIGPPGSTDHSAFDKILPEFGMAMKDMNVRPLSLSDRVSALSDGHVDAIVVLTGIASSAITELMTTKDAIYLQTPSEKIAKLNEKYPYYVEGVIPKGTYRNLNEDVTAVFTWGVMCVSAKSDEDLMYKITKLVFEKKDDIVEIISLAKELDPKNAIQVPLPLHSGAERYFREIGVIK